VTGLIHGRNGLDIHRAGDIVHRRRAGLPPVRRESSDARHKMWGLGTVGSNNALERLPIIPRENRAATYVDTILQGTKPADLPVEQVTRSELIINLKTTEAPGLTMPSRILFQADEVIR
jgi:ABC transporter substrate binding protein